MVTIFIYKSFIHGINILITILTYINILKRSEYFVSSISVLILVSNLEYTLLNEFIFVQI